MDWEKLTNDIIVAAATAAFGTLLSEKSDEHFYAFALYTDEYAETICPSANSIEGYEAKLRNGNETNKLQIASYKWATAKWAYEYWHADFFNEIYNDLKKYRKTFSNPKEDYAIYKNSVHECMISALKLMDKNGFFIKGREDITLFISSSHDDEADAF